MGTRTGRGATGPRERPGGAPLPIEDLEAIARAEARRYSGLAPNGGRRWTSEDIAFAVSVLYAIARTEAFRRAFPRGVDGSKSRGYLLSALHNALVRARRRDARLVLLDDLKLDAIPRAPGSAGHLAPEDARCLARRFLGGRSAAETAELERRLRGQGSGRAAIPGRGTGVPRATRVRMWARVSAALLTLARAEGLTKAELGDILVAVAAKLTGEGGGVGCRRGGGPSEVRGGGRIRGIAKILEPPGHARYSLLIGARN